ncbi:MAG: polysaccharide biosynthesis/export family protein [Terriglobales bacterium]
MKSALKKTAAGCFMVLLAALCAGAQQPAQTAAQPDSGYVLGPDDQIVIRAIDAPEISDKPMLIGTNGNLTLPLIGRVKAGGLTVEQFETELNTRLREYLREPQVSVTVVESRSHPVSVFGAVNKPGVVQLQGRKTLYEVLSMAGGPRDTTGSNLTVTRRRENGDIPLPNATIDPSGQFSVAELNVQEILGGKNPAANIEIKPNDVISVSEANSSMIYVVGDVKRAGAFALGGRQLSVLNALSLAGGLERTAKPAKARIVRNAPGELKRQEIAVNIKQILEGKAEDIGMRPQDVLVVPSSGSKTFATWFIPTTVSAAVSAAIYHY